MALAADFTSGGGGQTIRSGEGTAIVVDPEVGSALTSAAESTGITAGDFIPDPSGEFSSPNVSGGGDNFLGAQATSTSSNVTQTTADASDAAQQAAERVTRVVNVGGDGIGPLVLLGAAAVAVVALLT